MNVLFEDLTPEELQEICNGCGGKGGFIKPPHRIFFKAACDHHDYGYWKGNTEALRLICDNKFYEAMKQDCKNLVWYQKLRYQPWCWIYYRAVRSFGKKFFYYGEKPREIKRVIIKSVAELKKKESTELTELKSS